MRDEVIAALTLVRYPPAAVPAALLHMGLDRLVLARTPGLRFFRLLGSSRGLAAGRWDPYRYALWTVWDNTAALDAFAARSGIARRYRHVAAEQWTVQLAPVRWHGTWGGVDPFAGVVPSPAPGGGPWAILTRATLRPRYIRSFLRSSAAVTAMLAARPGLIASIGIGEVPLLYQATFSLWRDLAAVQAFAYAPSLHKDVITRTRTENWYREELFARFRPLASSGTWNGVDPLADLLVPPGM